jgi:MscS family membrane protein
MCTRIALACLLAGLLFAPVSLAQVDEESTEQDKPLIEDSAFKDNLGRDTPYSSFSEFLKATEKFDYELASNYLDLRNLPHAVRKYDGKELARQLDFVIKRGMMRVDVEQLSRKNSGQVVDGLPEYRDELGPVVGDDGEILLFMQRVPGLNDNFIWKVSNASVALVPELYDYFKYPDWVEDIRKKFPANMSFLGVELFKWVIVFGAAIILLPIFWLIGLALAHLVSNPKSPLFAQIRTFFTRPVPFMTTLIITGYLLQELGLGAKARVLYESKTLLTIIVVWVIFSAIDLLRARRREKFLAMGRADAHILGRPLANALKLLTLLTAVLVWLSNSGFEIGALLAGLGIGGVALALALQKPIEDLLGAVSLYSQQPMQAGDLCKYGEVLGSIEEIGLRTTRIRTLNDTLVSVPNCIIAHGAIENFSVRSKMLYHPDLPLRYDTSPKQMKAIIEDIESMACNHEKVITESVRVQFIRFDPNAMVIKMRVYVDETDFSAYLAVVGELNLAIMQIVQQHGAHFAQGATTVMLAGAELQTAS